VGLDQEGDAMTVNAGGLQPAGGRTGEAVALIWHAGQD